MVDEMRRQLDALMGTNRNERSGGVKQFTDPDVCPYFLCGVCPHDLFTNTKKALGPCPKLHSEPLRGQYEAERRNKDYGFERELARKFEEIVKDCEREVERQTRKLKENEEEKLESDPISRQLTDLQTQADQYGEEGKLDEYMRVTAQIELLKTKRTEQQAVQLPDGMTGQVIQQHGRQSQQQKLRVCEICGCFLSKFDTENRLADHFSGKLHTGYKEVREKLAELQKLGFGSDSRSSERDDHRGGSGSAWRKEHSSRDEPYSRSRDSHRDRDREYYDRDRDRNRDYRDRDRDRDSYRDRDNYRDRDRDSYRDSDRYRDRRYSSGGGDRGKR